MQYHVIDMANIPSSHYQLVDSAYELWKNIYSHELSQRGEVLQVEDFWTCRLLTIIEIEKTVIACHIYNSLHLRTNALEHKYFVDITQGRIAQLKARGTSTLMSMEYLLVNPAYRGRKSVTPWAEVLIALGLRVMLASPWDTAVGVARADKNVNKMSMKLGANEAESITKYETPCKVMLMHKDELKPHDNFEVQMTIEDLWRNRYSNVPWLVNQQLKYSAA